MLIPYQQLSHEALLGLIEEFVSRDGTDYGESEIPLERKRAQIIRQLKQGDVAIYFDEESGGCNIVPRASLPQPGR